jgi:hypothetical protein
MSSSESFGSFFRENTALLKEYVETRIEIYRLQGVRVFSKSAGFLIWLVIALFLFFLIAIFGGLVLAFWLSGLMESYTAGFGITTLILVLIFLILFAFRKKLFVDPVIRTVLKKTELEKDAKEEN